MSEVAKKVELLMLAFSLKSKNEILNVEANILEEESQMLCVLGLKINDEETAEILVKRLIEIKDRMKHLSELSSNLIKELKEADELDCIPNINNDVDFSELLKGIHKN
jgi:hypothetical protein